MNRWRLIWASLWHYRWLNLALVAGVALASAILSGSLAVGDSVRESLRRHGMARISQASLAVTGGERFFPQDLAQRFGAATGAATAPLLLGQAVVSTPGGEARANRVQLVGIDDSYWGFAAAKAPGLAGSQFAINEALAARLGIAIGERLVVSLEPPGLLSKDAPLSGASNEPVKLRGPVVRILSAAEFGRFSLNVEQVPTPSLFLPLALLQEKMDRKGRINAILLRGEVSADAASSALERIWTLPDASLRLARLDSGEWQLTTDRVFLEDALTQRLFAAFPQAQGVLSYLVNSIRTGAGKLTPYSMAAARMAPSLKPDEAAISDWLAADLSLREGDSLTLDYFVMGNARQLTEQSRTFRVARILPLAPPDFDRSWTPEFPGISNAENNADWEPGMPFHPERIRKKDEDYWDAHRTTPKLFLPLATGRELWANRFGSLTAIRFPAAAFASDAEFLARLHSLTSATEQGIAVRDLRQEVESAVANSYDFGGLFAGMSFFLILAALTLTSLLFLFSMEQRRQQVGLLLALGHRRAWVSRLFLAEAAGIALVGSSLGLPAGFLYTALALQGLGGAWQEAAAGVDLVYSAKPVSFIAGWSATFLLGLGVVALACRSLASVHPHQLLTGPAFVPSKVKRAGWLPFVAAAVLFATGAVIPFLPRHGPVMAQQGAFFGAGFLLVLAGILLAQGLLGWVAQRTQPLRSLSSLGLANAARRRWRSLSIIGLMASGVFMVTAINSLRLDARGIPSRPTSGTGGFDFLAESSLPVYEDLNTPEGRAVFGLPPAAAFHTIQFRSNGGDDASCLNLNRAQRPRILGTNPQLLAGKFFFSAERQPGAGWTQLTTEPSVAPDGVTTIPGILDQATAEYGLGISLGGVIDAVSADGKPFRIQIAGLLDNSVLQGNIIIAEQAFLRLFPNTSGYRLFFIEDHTPDKSAGALLSRQLEDRGLELVPAWRRLNEFNAVQNTYLGIFSVLGGLGLLLATAGLGIVVSRNILERRSQLALLNSIGFRRNQLAWLIVSEHWFLHGFGVLLGIAAGAFAVLPTLSVRSSAAPVLLLALLNGAILAGGLLFCWLAARGMLRGPLIDSLRHE